MRAQDLAELPFGSRTRHLKRQKEEARTAAIKRRALEADRTRNVPRAVLSKEELLQQRRERYQADKERIRRMSPFRSFAPRERFAAMVHPSHGGEVIQ
jgi:hypothetical protein